MVYRFETSPFAMAVKTYCGINLGLALFIGLDSEFLS
jgi:hypothetical protein